MENGDWNIKFLNKKMFMEKLIDPVNYKSYQLLYKTMEYAHFYPNENLVRLEKWFLKKPGHVLDHGCGYGENMIFLTTLGYKVTSIEISPDLIDYVKLKCQIRKVPPNLFELKMLNDRNRLPFDKKVFDYVISLGVLEYLGSRKSAIFCINELIRCLKVGGKAIISIMTPKNTFAIESMRLDDEVYFFDGKEKDKDIHLKYNLFIPKSEDTFASLFPPECKIYEIGFWDNSYCGVRGEHYVALVSKNK